MRGLHWRGSEVRYEELDLRQELHLAGEWGWKGHTAAVEGAEGRLPVLHEQAAVLPGASNDAGCTKVPAIAGERSTEVAEEGDERRKR